MHSLLLQVSSFINSLVLRLIWNIFTNFKGHSSSTFVLHASVKVLP